MLDKGKLKGKRNPSRGLSLIELMITVVILVIVLIGLLQLFIYCLGLAQMAGNLTIAITEAQGKLEEIRNEDFGSIIANYNGPFNINDLDLDGKGRVDTSYVAGSSNSLIEVRIVICWRQKGGRIIGEDTNLNGALDAGEDDNGDGKLDSPASVVSLIAER